jgi:hypothetical protein
MQPAPESTRLTTHVASHESARSTLTPAKPSASTASTQIGLADSQLAKPISLVPAVADASLDDSTLIDRSSEIKNHIIQIKDIHFFNMINKVQNTNIFLKFQSGHTILISASIRDILGSSCNRPINNGNLFVNNKINSDSIGQHILPYGKADNSSLSKLRPSKSNCKAVAEWIDNKSDRFVCLALKLTPQKNWLNKLKYSFDFTFYDHVFDILLKNNFIRIIYHNVLSLIQNLEELIYCKWHNSFDHNTCDCNIFIV